MFFSCISTMCIIIIWLNKLVLFWGISYVTVDEGIHLQATTRVTIVFIMDINSVRTKEPAYKTQ